jgi:hypothetical protein
MKISQMIATLNAILATEGDLRVTVFDTYTENEGWDYDHVDLWCDAVPSLDWVTDDDDNKVEKVVVL